MHCSLKGNDQMMRSIFSRERIKSKNWQTVNSCLTYPRENLEVICLLCRTEVTNIFSLEFLFKNILLVLSGFHISCFDPFYPIPQALQIHPLSIPHPTFHPLSIYYPILHLFFFKTIQSNLCFLYTLTLPTDPGCCSD